MKPAFADAMFAARKGDAYHITCLVEGCTAHTDIHFGGGSLPPNIIARKAEQRGWRIDPKGRATCPHHLKKEEKKAVSKPEMIMPVAEVPRVAANKVEALPPREPSQTDRRRIFREIDDNWDEAQARYTGSTTDQTIAEKLSVPRAWVAEARSEAFGDQRNEMAEQVGKELEALKARADQLSAESLEFAAKYEQLARDVIITQKKAAKLS